MAGWTLLMETLGGFPNLPALWLRPAKPASANPIAGPHDVRVGSSLMRNAG
jgi:hypothetical protein